MSGYPPFGYPFQGAQPPPQQQQYPPYQPYGAYPPPTNGFSATPTQSQQPPQYPPPTSSYYANAQSAYNYNASSIPGLGTPSNAPALPTPYNGTWNQGGYGNVAPQAQYPVYSPPVPTSSAPVTYPYSQGPPPGLQASHPVISNQPTLPKKQSESAPKPQPKLQPTAQSKLSGNNTAIQEDGEIDDGYFDDLYDDAPKAPSVTNETADVLDKTSSKVIENGSEQNTDMEDVSATQESASAMAAGKTHNGNVLANSDRSRSYSPRLTPTEIRGGQVPATTTAFNGRARAAPASIPPQSSKSPVVDTGAHNVSPLAVNTFSAVPTACKLFATVAEARNEAKKAILRLLPHGVKYQTYIDEGFDASLIKELFTQLNLPVSPTVSAASEKTDTPLDKESQAPKPALPKPGPADTVAKTQEERKDRIARLMAEKQAAKKAKNATATSNAESVMKANSINGATTATPMSAPSVKPPITRAEKDLLLQQKVEALRAKARESKKLAQKQVAPQVPKPDATKQPRATQVPVMTTQTPVAVQSAARSTAGTPLSSASQSAAASPAITALPLLPRAGAKINQRKRPVAADFMDYPSPAAKRPSLANRENSSLVISVSDDDDEDDDVEMEVESATEDSPTPLQQTLSLTARRGPSIRDYPPLKDFSNSRQVPSPVSGISASGSKNPNADLQSKERAIMEMNMKIKALEARKQAKAKSGNVTPQSPSAGGFTPTEQASKPQSPVAGNTTLVSLALKTPTRGVLPSSDTDDKSTPSTQLLQEAEAANTPHYLPSLAKSDCRIEEERHIRGRSVQAAAKSAKLKKAELLRQMQEQMQRLQAEIEQEDDEGDDDEDSVEDVRHNEVELAAEVGSTEAAQGMIASIVHESGELLASPATHYSDTEKTNLAVWEDPYVEVKPTKTTELTVEDGIAVSTPSFPDTVSQTPSIGNESVLATSGVDLVAAIPNHVETLSDQCATYTPTVVAASGKLPDSLTSVKSAGTRDGESESAVVELDESDEYEPPEPKVDESLTADLPMSNPVPTETAFPVPQRRNLLTETAREAIDSTAPSQQASLAPYESPLRYYHAYRFHPSYDNGVQGGLKSLTYSNRIDPNKEMCPDEWEGNDCPRGDACQFQHWQSIIAPDSEIILELGSSDEFSGEKKRDFNNGLREVVSSFQKSKVRDFRTIAGAILDFRRRFLGDASKVLRLEGVNT